MNDLIPLKRWRWQFCYNHPHDGLMPVSHTVQGMQRFYCRQCVAKLPVEPEPGTGKRSHQKRDIDSLIGQRFGRLVVQALVGYAPLGTTGKKVGILQCLCDCGNECQVRSHDLIYENSKSCGCRRKELCQSLSLIRAVPVVHAATGEKFQSISQAARAHGIPISSLRHAVLKGKEIAGSRWIVESQESVA